MYSHYYTIGDLDGDLHFDEVSADIMTMIERSELPIGDGFGTIGSKPEIEDGRLSFNGIQPDEYETFTYPRIGEYWTAVPGFEACKTDYRPYDPIVCASLLAIRHHLGNGVDISSDGRPATDEEWRQGIAIYNHCFPDRTPYTEDSVTALLDARNEFLHSAA